MNDPVNVLRQSPAEREAAKSAAERAEDVAYTLNHAISCGMNDMLIAPTISAWFGVQVGCSDPTHNHGHGTHEHKEHKHHSHEHDHHMHKPDRHSHADHGHSHHPAHAHVKSKFSWKRYRSEALHYLRGEIIGDALAVPLTIGVQRFFPGVMEMIRRGVEPIAMPFFRRGAQETAKQWGSKQHLASDAPEVVARAEMLCRNEMKHLPQAVMWNIFAFPIGVVAQKMGGHGSSTARIIRNKSIGAIISNVLLLGSRALVPNMAQQWDAMNGEHIVAPVSRVMDRAFGVAQSSGWVTRVENPPLADQVMR